VILIRFCCLLDKNTFRTARNKHFLLSLSLSLSLPPPHRRKTPLQPTRERDRVDAQSPGEATTCSPRYARPGGRTVSAAEKPYDFRRRSVRATDRPRGRNERKRDGEYIPKQRTPSGSILPSRRPRFVVFFPFLFGYSRCAAVGRVDAAVGFITSNRRVRPREKEREYVVRGG